MNRVDRMNEIKQKFCIANILEGLAGNGIPYTYDKGRRAIYIGGINATKLLLAACEVYVRREEELHSITAKDRLEILSKLTEAKTHIHRLLVLLTEGKHSYAVIDEARAFMKED